MTDHHDVSSDLERYRAELAAASIEADAARAVKAEADARAEVAEELERGLQDIVKGLEAVSRARRPDQERLPIGSDESARAEAASNNGHDDTPRGQDAVLAILNASTVDLSAAELAKEIVAREWIKSGAKNPGAAVRQALKRLLEDGKIARGASPFTYRKLPGDAGEATVVAT